MLVLRIYALFFNCENFFIKFLKKSFIYLCMGSPEVTEVAH